MPSLGKRIVACLGRPVRGWSRVLLLVLSVGLVCSFAGPLWRIRLVAPQYPEGLQLDVYLYKLEGGHEGHDVAEINELNHYIGMMTIDRRQLSDLDWLPFAFGVLALLGFRAAAIGSGRDLVDLSFLTVFTSLFSLGRFVYKLYVFGHYLDPHAPFHVKPFMPAILGSKQVANFTSSSYPLWGSAFVAAAVLGVLALTLWHFRAALSWRRPADRPAGQKAPDRNGRPEGSLAPAGTAG